MALIACKECGHLLSNKAGSCRHCGAPAVGRLDPATRLRLAAAACLIAFAALWSANRSALSVSAAPGSPSVDAGAVDAGAVDAAAVGAAAPVQLRSPATDLDAVPMRVARAASWPMRRYRSNFPTLAAHCGPAVDPTTTAAVVKTESDYNALIVRDNTARVTFDPPDPVSAQALVEAAMRAGHQLAIGLMQVTTPWARKLHLRPADLLDPCTNIRVGTSILAADYRACALAGRTKNGTLACALSMYWSGHPTVGGAYVNQVYRHAGSAEHVRETAGISDGELGATEGERRP